MSNQQSAINNQQSKAAVLLVIIAVWLLFFWPVFTPVAADRVQLEAGDFTLQFLAFRQFGLDEMRQGRWPLWLPCVDSGYPYFADPQAASFYPPALINWGAHLLSGSPTFSMGALELEAALHILLAALTAYGFLRGEVRSRLAALLGALTFSFGGYLLSYPMLQLAILETAAWLPLVMWSMRRLAARGSARSVVLAGGVLAIGALAGHPQTLVMMGYAGVAYFAFCARSARLRTGRALLRLSAVALLALLLSAIQLLPTFEFMRLSSRAGLSLDAAGTGFPLSDIVQFVRPGAISRYSPLYIGLLPLALAAFAIGAASGLSENSIRTHFFTAKPLRSPSKPLKLRVLGALSGSKCASARVWFWGIVGLVALLISFGNQLPIFGALYWLAPGFRLFRDQERHALIVVWALSLLAAYGGERLFQRLTPQPPLLKSKRRFQERGSGLLPSPENCFSFSGEGPGVRRWLPVALLILVVIDLAANNRSVNWVAPYDPFPAQAALTTIEADAPAGAIFRLHNEQRLPGHAACVAGLNEVGGITPIHIAAYQDFIKQVPREVRWQLLNVCYVVTWRSVLDGHLGQPIDSTLLLQQGEGSDATYLYRLTEDHPRAWIVHEVEVKADRAAIYAALAAPDFDVRRMALTMTPVNVVTNQAVEPISITRLASNQISLETTLTTPGLLILSEVNYPGWAATVNGVAQPVIEVDGTLRGVALDAGESRVEMTFQPASLHIGGAVSVLAIVIGGVGLGWSGRRRGGVERPCTTADVAK